MANLTKSQAAIIWDCASRGGDFPSTADRENPEAANRVALVDHLATGATTIPGHLMAGALGWAEEFADRDEYNPTRIAAARRACGTLRKAIDERRTER